MRIWDCFSTFDGVICVVHLEEIWHALSTVFYQFPSVASKSTRSTYSLKEVLAHQILQWQFYLVWADQEQLKIATTGTLVDLFLALYLVTKDSKSGSPKWDTILLIHSIKDSESLC